MRGWWRLGRAESIQTISFKIALPLQPADTAQRLKGRSLPVRQPHRTRLFWLGIGLAASAGLRAAEALSGAAPHAARFA